jgi:hypothetical protein
MIVADLAGVSPFVSRVAVSSGFFNTEEAGGPRSITEKNVALSDGAARVVDKTERTNVEQQTLRESGRKRIRLQVPVCRVPGTARQISVALRGPPAFSVIKLEKERTNTRRTSYPHPSNDP